jgi:hypothetical protein
MNRTSAILTMVLLTFGAFTAIGLRTSNATSCGPGQFCGNVYVSTVFSGVDKINFLYDSSTHSLTFSPDSVIVSGLGQSDGLIFDPVTGDLLDGVNCGGPNSFHEIDPATGSIVGTFSSDGVQPSHLMADPAGNVWASPDGCSFASGFNDVMVAPFSNLNGAVANVITGPDNFVNTVIFTPSSGAFYTSSGCCGGNGHFGRLDTTTFITTCVTDPTGACENFPAAHGGTYDPFTGDVIIFGDDHITQINPATLAVVSDLNVPGCGFDQGAADGFGHLFVAGCGGVFFLDYSSTGLVGSALNFAQKNSCCAGGGADDVAPLIGPGSLPTPVFPFGTVTMMAATLGAFALVWFLKTRTIRR